MGVPFIASPTGPYIELAERYGIGRLASTPTEWAQHLADLADPELRAHLGRTYRTLVSEHNLTYERQADRWWVAYTQARANRLAPVTA